MISKIKDRTVIISTDNFERISKLYEELNSDELERVVNNHIAVALDEIEEDLKKVHRCIDCKYLQSVNLEQQNYYCDNEKRINDMGKLTENNLFEVSPVWCPKHGRHTPFKSMGIS